MDQKPGGPAGFPKSHSGDKPTQKWLSLSKATPGTCSDMGLQRGQAGADGRHCRIPEQWLSHVPSADHSLNYSEVGNCMKELCIPLLLLMQPSHPRDCLKSLQLLPLNNSRPLLRKAHKRQQRKTPTWSSHLLHGA